MRAAQNRLDVVGSRLFQFPRHELLVPCPRSVKSTKRTRRGWDALPGLCKITNYRAGTVAAADVPGDARVIAGGVSPCRSGEWNRHGCRGGRGDKQFLEHAFPFVVFPLVVDVFADSKPYAAPSRLVTEPSNSGDEDAISDFVLDQHGEAALTPGYGASSPQPCWSCAFIDTVRRSTCSGQIPNPDVTPDALVARWPRSFRPEDYDYAEPIDCPS